MVRIKGKGREVEKKSLQKSNLMKNSHPNTAKNF